MRNENIDKAFIEAYSKVVTPGFEQGLGEELSAKFKSAAKFIFFAGTQFMAEEIQKEIVKSVPEIKSKTPEAADD